MLRCNRRMAEDSSTGYATADQIRSGELRFLTGGATSIVGSGGQADCCATSTARTSRRASLTRRSTSIRFRSATRMGCGGSLTAAAVEPPRRLRASRTTMHMRHKPPKGSMRLRAMSSSARPRARTIRPATNEPSCIPTGPMSVNGSTTYTGTANANDRDGDGIPDAADRCPDVSTRSAPWTTVSRVMRMGMALATPAIPARSARIRRHALRSIRRTATMMGRERRRQLSRLRNSRSSRHRLVWQGRCRDVCPTIQSRTQWVPDDQLQVRMKNTPCWYHHGQIENALVTGRGSNGFFVGQRG